MITKVKTNPGSSKSSASTKEELEMLKDISAYETLQLVKLKLGKTKGKLHILSMAI